VAAGVSKGVLVGSTTGVALGRGIVSVVSDALNRGVIVAVVVKTETGEGLRGSVWAFGVVRFSLPALPVPLLAAKSDVI
jgi:hypothetical protein